MPLSEVALWTHGAVRGTDVAVRGIGIDSRRIEAGNLFVALPGERSDGHQHLDEAAARGAAAALVARRMPGALPQVEVRDTQAALSDLASAVRARSHAQVVGITGSNGKTTVKNMLGAILAGHGRCHVSAGNHNNEIGLPLAVIACPEDADFAVYEMGAGKPGDIAFLAAIARPHVGLVNNIAGAHLARMGSVQGVAETKGALYEALPASGTAVINADDAFADYFARRAGNRRQLRFALQAAAEVGARDVRTQGGGSRFTLVTPAGEAAVELALAGRHNVRNALAAAAVALALEVPVPTIATALATVCAEPGRLTLHAMPGGWTLIDDSYNANPASLAAAIDSVVARPGEAWLVLGDMAELGEDARALHAEAGRQAQARGVARLWTTGPLAEAAAAAFAGDAQHFATVADLAAALASSLHGGVNCLVKGSRSAGMERVVAALRADPRWGDSDAA